MSVKQCSKCKEFKPSTSEYFHKHANRCGLRPDCKLCSAVQRKNYRDANKDRISVSKRRYHYDNRDRILEKWRKKALVRRYGITREEREVILKQQGGSCICGYNDRSSYSKFPVVDHCHTTNKVRGVLCQRCNTTLGKVQDNPELLRKLADYLESHSS
ncbi:endonuclease VII domain-containing protein [Paenibacillus sp. GYB004]|uniref:endonuclease VII domain-containing protein n=1 Tax=Paenibacillus sp. GYB004 TaxID=2994393 RepID=UPI003FA7C713